MANRNTIKNTRNTKVIYFLLLNINIQRKPWPLNGVDAASQENIDMYR